VNGKTLETRDARTGRASNDMFFYGGGHSGGPTGSSSFIAECGVQDLRGSLPRPRPVPLNKGLRLLATQSFKLVRRHVQFADEHGDYPGLVLHDLFGVKWHGSFNRLVQANAVPELGL
jgi:hypothetical protein